MRGPSSSFFLIPLLVSLIVVLHAVSLTHATPTCGGSAALNGFGEWRRHLVAGDSAGHVWSGYKESAFRDFPVDGSSTNAVLIGPITKIMLNVADGTPDSLYFMDAYARYYNPENSYTGNSPSLSTYFRRFSNGRVSSVQFYQDNPYDHYERPFMPRGAKDTMVFFNALRANLNMLTFPSTMSDREYCAWVYPDSHTQLKECIKYGYLYGGYRPFIPVPNPGEALPSTYDQRNRGFCVHKTPANSFGKTCDCGDDRGFNCNCVIHTTSRGYRYGGNADGPIGTALFGTIERVFEHPLVDGVYYIIDSPDSNYPEGYDVCSWVPGGSYIREINTVTNTVSTRIIRLTESSPLYSDGKYPNPTFYQYKNGRLHALESFPPTPGTPYTEVNYVDVGVGDIGTLLGVVKGQPNLIVTLKSTEAGIFDTSTNTYCRIGDPFPFTVQNPQGAAYNSQTNELYIAIAGSASASTIEKLSFGISSTFTYCDTVQDCSLVGSQICNLNRCIIPYPPFQCFSDADCHGPNNGRCVSGNCECFQGIGMPDCSCRPVETCNGHGTCSAFPDALTSLVGCKCFLNWAGGHCDICAKGWAGANCDQYIGGPSGNGSSCSGVNCGRAVMGWCGWDQDCLGFGLGALADNGGRIDGGSCNLSTHTCTCKPGNVGSNCQCRQEASCGAGYRLYDWITGARLGCSATCP